MYHYYHIAESNYDYIQLTLEQHGFELCVFTYTQFFFQ